jgi:hypothetical protein
MMRNEKNVATAEKVDIKINIEKNVYVKKE